MAAPGARPGLVAGFVRKARERPDLVIPGVLAIVNGLWHRLKFRLLGKRVSIGRGLRVYGALRISGPGRVVIGDDCLILGKTLRPVSLITWDRAATITLGHSVGLNGTVVNCYERIEIGDLANLADAYVIDSSAHHLSADRRFLPTSTVPRAPVRIERNVWVSVGVIILKGVTIGQNSVVAASTLVRRDVPPDTIVAGNPLRELGRVPAKLDAGGG